MLGGEYYNLLLKHKLPNMSWYCADVHILSKTEIGFVIFDMDCPVYGGKGNSISQFTITVTENVTAEAIRNKALILAKFKYAKEQKRREEAIVNSYADEILEQLK